MRRSLTQFCKSWDAQFCGSWDAQWLSFVSHGTLSNSVLWVVRRSVAHFCGSWDAQRLSFVGLGTYFLSRSLGESTQQDEISHMSLILIFSRFDV